tara:strand:- start:6132 stop:8351 length:2220 start_codon:yes stop_codon:yes gene_type:complete
MSDKKSKQSESNLPDGGHVPTSGFNYGLDGFDFDMDYGDGVEDGAALPEAYGLAELPEGIMPESPDEKEATPEGYTGPAVDVGVRYGPLQNHMADPWGLLKSGQVMDAKENAQLAEGSSLSDLNWLDPTLGQDPDRLPVNPVDKSQAALEEAWMGTNTNGLELIPNRNKEILQYQSEVRDPGQTSGLPGYDNVKAAMLRAMRRVSCGYTLEQSLKEAAEAIGKPDPTARAVANRLADEFGLLGNVYIRASAFPQMHNGKWDAVIKKKCVTAAYIIAEPNTKMAAFERYLGKKVVSSVDWDEALSFYAPRLKAVGIKVAGSSDPRSLLKKAFLAKPKTSNKSKTAFVTHKTPVETVGLKEAQEKFAKSEHTRELIKADSLEDVLVSRAQKRVVSLVKQGFLTESEAKKIVNSNITPREMLRLATQKAFKEKTKEYKTSGVHTKNKVSLRQAKAEWAKSVTEELKQSKLSQAKEHIVSLVSKGQLTKRQADRLLKSDRNAGELIHAASAVISMNASKRGGIQNTEVKEYTGKVYKQMIPEKRAQKTSSVDIKRMLKWARLQMTEGVLGQDLTDLIKHRFSPNLITSASEELVQIRDSHEGLSGQVYVDTEAYASVEGTNGCDKGANKHRANGIKFALCMPRCGTCKFANQLPDGTSVCQKYNKILVNEAPVEDVKSYQKEAIRLSNASDAEITASLFNSYDPSEFNLTNQAMSDVSVDDAPGFEQLSGVFFGGIDIGEGDE